MKELNITERNFFRLLRAGLSGQEEQIEPMSAWKWQCVYRYSLIHGVTALLYDGIQLCKKQFFLSIPAGLTEQWEQTTKETEKMYQQEGQRLASLFASFNQSQLRPVLMGGRGLAAYYDQPSHRFSEKTAIFFPFETQGNKADKWAWENGNAVADHGRWIGYTWQDWHIEHHHRLVGLSNTLHSRTLANVVEQEFRESPPTFMPVGGMRIELLSPTLMLLYLLLQNACCLLSEGVDLSILSDIDIFMRKVGDKVDFVKLQSWLNRLHMQKMATLTGGLLEHLFAFSRDEIPFMAESDEVSIEQPLKDLFSLRTPHEWHFQQAGNIFVHTANSSALLWHIRHSARYFTYCPTESVTHFFSTISHSLSHIEE